jgi:hypothetical protein
MPDTILKLDNQRRAIAKSMPKKALSLRQIELIAIETEGQHFFSYKLLEWFPKMEDSRKLASNPLLSLRTPA